MPKASISVFFPCYNDKGTIVKLAKTVDRVLAKRRLKHEIIVVDDGSSDGSRETLRNLAKEMGSLKLVFHKKNRGYGGVLKTGFNTAKYDLVFYTDGDAQYDVRELDLLIPLMTEDIDVVNGIKMFRNDPWYRIVIGNMYNFFVRNVFGIDIIDTDCDFRLIRKTLLNRIDLTSDSGSICVELIKKLQNAGARFRQVSVHHYPRVYGSSQFFNVKRVWRTGMELVILWLDLNFK